MKNRHKTTWKCFSCGTPTLVMHELCCGRGIRPLAEEYSIQLPHCPLCHLYPHNRAKGSVHPPEAKGNVLLYKKTPDECTAVYADYMGVDMEKIEFELRNPYDKEKNPRHYLEKVKPLFEKKIKSLEW